MLATRMRMATGGTLTPGCPYSLEFDGSTGYANDGTGAEFYFQSTDAFTFEAWIRVAASPNSQMYVVNRSGTGSTDRNWGLLIQDGTKLSLYSNGNTTDTAALLSTETWHHVAVTVATGTTNAVKFYVDGTLAETHNKPTWRDQATAKLRFATQGEGGGAGFKGRIFDARIWSTERTAQEIANNYQRRLSGSESGLVGYWQFDEGTGEPQDQTANANHLTRTGTTAWVAC